MNTEVAKAMVVAAWMTVGFVGFGGWLLMRIGYARRPADAVRFLPVAAAIGFAATTYVAYPLIAFGPPPPVLVIAWSAFGCVIGRGFFAAVMRGAQTSMRELAASISTPAFVACGILATTYLALASMNWLTPVKEGDALRGYMFTARWLYSNGFMFPPYNTLYAVFPTNTEMVFALSYGFGTDLIGKVIDGFLGVLLLVAVYEFARRYAGAFSSFVAALSLGMATEFIISWGVGKIDVLTTFTFIGGISLLLARGAGTPLAAIATAAFLVGTSSAQKYTIWVLVPSVLAAVWLLSRAQGVRRALASVTLASCVLALCVVPHFVKSIAWTGNPVAPFGMGVFPTTGVYVDIHDFNDAVPTTAADVLVLPYKLFLDPAAKRWPGPFPLMLLVGLPMLLFRKSTPAGVKVVLAIAAVQMVLWIAIRRADWLAPRFLLVPTALLLVASAAGVEVLVRRRGAVRTVTVAAALSLVAWSGVWQNRHYRHSWPFVAGLETRVEWQDRVVPFRGFAAFHRIAPDLNEQRRLFTATSLYNLPQDKIPYLSTEREVVEYEAIPETQQLKYLRSNCFAYFHMLLSGAERVPSWANQLEVAAEYRSVGSPSLEFVLLRLDNPSADNECESVSIGRESRVAHAGGLARAPACSCGS